MAQVFHPLLMLLARTTQAEMVQMIDYLKTENRILRSKLSAAPRSGGHPAHETLLR